MVQMAMFNFQRVITLKVGKSELRFMCSASHLIVLYINVKFRENNCENIERTRVHSRNCFFQYLLCSKGLNSKNRLTRVTVFSVLHIVSWCFTFMTNFIISQMVSTYRADNKLCVGIQSDHVLAALIQFTAMNP